MTDGDHPHFAAVFPPLPPPWRGWRKAADGEVKVVAGQVSAFRHVDAVAPAAGRVWVVWAVAGTGNARVKVPVVRDRVKIVGVDGSESFQNADPETREITVDLVGDAKMAAGVMVIDRGE